MPTSRLGARNSRDAAAACLSCGVDARGAAEADLYRTNTPQNNALTGIGLVNALLIQRRTVGSGHMPTVLTASAASNGPSLTDRRSIGVCTRRTRPAPYGGPVAATGLVDHHLRVVDADDQSPVDTRVASAAMATPGPQPSSMTRSVSWTSRSCTAQRLRATFDERRPMIQPAPVSSARQNLVSRFGVKFGSVRSDTAVALRPRSRR